MLLIRKALFGVYGCILFYVHIIIRSDCVLHQSALHGTRFVFEIWHASVSHSLPKSVGANVVCAKLFFQLLTWEIRAIWVQSFDFTRIIVYKDFIAPLDILGQIELARWTWAKLHIVEVTVIRKSLSFVQARLVMENVACTAVEAVVSVVVVSEVVGVVYADQLI